MPSPIKIESNKAIATSAPAALGTRNSSKRLTRGWSSSLRTKANTTGSKVSCAMYKQASTAIAQSVPWKIVCARCGSGISRNSSETWPLGSRLSACKSFICC
jgi:hypothetical protein